MANLAQLKQWNTITYILYIVGLFVGLTSIIAVIMNYLKRKEMLGTWLESHVEWQITTFWMGLLGYIIGTVLIVVLVGYVILLAVFIWQVYRVIKGIMALNEEREVF